MASFRKRGKRWHAEVRKSRPPLYASDTFGTKAEAQAWAIKVEADWLAGKHGEIPDQSFGALLERYRDTVSVTKRGERWERLRIDVLLRDPIARVRLADLDETHFAAWRDRRLEVVSAGSVLREWTLVSHACSIAVKEWKWLRFNPLIGLRRPPEPLPRDRRISAGEIKRLLLALGDDYTTVTGRVGLAMRFAIETAMRAGEIAGLTRDKVKGKVARLERTKTGAARDVPLSKEALRILALLPKGDRLFDLTTQQIDVLFRKAKDRALVKDLHFHDTRHEAITRLAGKLNVLELARMVGHRDLRMLQVYYNETADALAAKLD